MQTAQSVPFDWGHFRGQRTAGLGKVHNVDSGPRPTSVRFYKDTKPSKLSSTELGGESLTASVSSDELGAKANLVLDGCRGEAGRQVAEDLSAPPEPCAAQGTDPSRGAERAKLSVMGLQA